MNTKGSRRVDTDQGPDITCHVADEVPLGPSLEHALVDQTGR